MQNTNKNREDFKANVLKMYKKVNWFKCMENFTVLTIHT